MSLRFTILGFLSIRPLTGYDLKRYFDASVRHFWSADQAAIYRTLGELAGDGLVEHERIAQQTRPDRKVYHATPAGLAALDAWLATPAPPVARREPLLVKLFFTGRLAPSARRAGGE
jgi:DNA-binding PadR family transcriptional regulator